MTTIDGINYNLGSNTATVGNNQNFSGAAIIPSTVTDNGTSYTVVAIGDQAFFNCSGLTSLTIGNSVTSIGYQAFYECSGLTSLTIGNSVTRIGDSAFYYCTRLTSVTIPASVTSIGDNAFVYCISLTEITVDSNNITYISVDGVLFNKSKTILIQFPAKKTVVLYTIPESVTSIGNGAFAYCTGLTSLTIGSSVTIIGNAAFLACSKLTSLTIGSGVTSIGNAAFAYCTGLTSVSIPASVTTIGNGAFQGCSGLTSVSIPASVTSIGFAAFQGCTGVFSAYFFGDYFTESGPAFKGNLDTTIYVRSDAAGWGTTWGGCNVIKSIVKHNYSIYFRKN